ncbi:MAG: PAS domain S-box protein [Bacteroidota bacterium]|nr:PAS domain S-box protein [Bacteroidota bacterium]
MAIQSKQILLVEDEAIIALLETNWLKNEGYIVYQAVNGEEAVKFYKENIIPIDLIIMDIDLGAGKDGIETAKEILKINDVPIVFLSSHTEREFVEKTDQITSYGFVVKDSRSTVLLAVVKMAFKLFDAHKEVKKTDVLLNAVLESSEEIYLFVVGKDYKYLSFNKKHKEAIYKYWGKEIEIGMNMLDVFSEQQFRERVKENIDRALSGESFITIEEHSDEKSSTVYWESHWNPIYNLKGKLIGLTCFVLNVTAKVQAETLLRESAGKFEAIIKVSIDGFWINDADGKLIDVNPACCSLLGYSRQELLNMSISQIDMLESSEDVKEHTMKIHAFGFDRFETKFRKKDGSSIDVEVSTTFNPENNLIIAFIKDISERKFSESLIKESELRLRRAVENAPYPIMIHTEDGEVQFLNAAWVRLTGYTFRDMPKVSMWKELAGLKSEYHRHDSPDISYDKDSIIKDGEYYIKTRDGKCLIWDIRSAALGRLADGRSAIISMATDITEKKTIEEALIKSEEQYRMIVSEMDQGLAFHEIIQDKDGKVVDYRFLEINESYEKITGLKRENIIGKTVREVLPNIENYWIEVYGQVALTGIPIHFENLAAELDKYFSVYAYSPKKNHFAVMVTDVTKRTKEEKIIHKQNEELKEVNAAKDKLFSIIAHDLRGPFSGFMGLLEGLANNIDNFEKEDITRSAEVMHTTAKKIYELLNNLLEWSRLQLGKTEFKPKTINLFNIIEELEQLFRSATTNKSISFNNLVNPDIYISGDQNMLLTVLRNLISNAIKFTNLGGEVLINAREESEMIEILVSDNGVGIPQNLIENLFSIDAAFTTKGTNGEEGSGLGLMLCNELVKKNKGSIRVLSEVGKGTSFVILLPKSSGPN